VNTITQVSNKVRVATLTAELKVIRSEMISQLPWATPEQVTACIEAAREITVKLEVAQVASGLNKDFRLTEEQIDQVAAAKAAHAAFINLPEQKASAVSYVTNSTLKTFKLKTKKDGTIAVSITGSLTPAKGQ